MKKYAGLKKTFAVLLALVMLLSAFVMALAGLLYKKLKWRWISDYALPISLIAGMAGAIPITAWLS